MDDTCYFCVAYVPEGRMVCRGCEEDMMARSEALSARWFCVRGIRPDGRHLYVQFLDDQPHELTEACAYALEAVRRHPEAHSVAVRFEGEEAVLDCVVHQAKFEHIRRITGYLTGTADRWNNAKRAELHDRVMHGTDGSAAAGLIEEE